MKITTKFDVLVLNGPNLNMLGKREPEIYGTETLEASMAELSDRAQAMSINLQHFQSNAEHELIDKIHQSFKKIDYIIINPAAFSHSSVAIRDALLAVNIPFIEVHISNIHARESFRHHSYFSDVASGVICGMGLQGYEFALMAAQQRLIKQV